MLVTVARPRLQDVVGELRAANHDVRNVGVGVVVAQRGTVEPGGVQPGGQRDAHRRGLVPFVLPAGMNVGVVVAEQHVHRLRARRADGFHLESQRLRNVSGHGRGAVARHRHLARKGA